jgi:hypothetical protein
MDLDQKKNFIDWMTEIILAFEEFFHRIQAWFEGTIMQQDWFKNLMATATDAASKSDA